jgi:hypothetical protein
MVRANEFGVTEVELFENYWVSDVEFKVIKSMSKYKQNKLIKDLKQAMDLKKRENDKLANRKGKKKVVKKVSGTGL